ncbi:hypothetical protein MTBBW1_1260020 [Desulfamplus magnetovallimortis]|uniref:Uncharacterized protein n=1 Tax=Desulfamplus magnetovallimortis TaxID=1246637 RepID=A0A1W1H6U5_9BACT|nr:hypothetical protein MTBBW1_1260020 [Desulfamplus magnetovallimortis]
MAAPVPMITPFRTSSPLDLPAWADETNSVWATIAVIVMIMMEILFFMINLH